MSDSTRPDPARPTSPSVREIADLTARLRALSTRGAAVDPTERERFLADKDALLARIQHVDRDELGGPNDDADRRMAAMGDERWSGPSAETVTRAEAAARLVDVGFDRVSAEAMITEYQYESSRAVGVPVYQWGLDQHDVDAIADTYRWVARDRGESLDEARQRAAREAGRWSGRAADDPEQAARSERAARLWADLARVPEPFTPDSAEDAEEPLSSTALVEQAHQTVAGLPAPREPVEESARWEPATSEDADGDEFELTYGAPVTDGGDR